MTYDEYLVVNFADNLRFVIKLINVGFNYKVNWVKWIRYLFSVKVLVVLTNINSSISTIISTVHTLKTYFLNLLLVKLQKNKNIERNFHKINNSIYVLSLNICYRKFHPYCKMKNGNTFWLLALHKFLI